MPIDSRKYYKRGVLLPAALIVIVHFISYIIHENSVTPGYESEYFTEDALNGAAFVLVLINTIIVLTLCSPILLLDLDGKGKTTRFLWWFLLPGSWLIYLSYSGVKSWLHGSDHNSDAFYTLSNSVPYLVGLIWSYVKYNRELANMKNGLPDLEVITKEDREIDQPHTPPPQSPMG